MPSEDAVKQILFAPGAGVYRGYFC